MGIDQQRRASRLCANRLDRQWSRNQRLVVADQQAPSALCQSIRRRRRAAHLVCRDLAGGEAGRLLWPGLVLRIEGATGGGKDHAASEGSSEGGTALGCLRRADRSIIR